VNEPVIYRLAQTIYDFLDEKIVFLNDEQHPDNSNLPVESKTTDYIKYSKRLSIPQLSPEGRINFSMLKVIIIS
jgi:hypothetical protein